MTNIAFCRAGTHITFLRPGTFLDTFFWFIAMHRGLTCVDIFGDRASSDDTDLSEPKLIFLFARPIFSGSRWNRWHSRRPCVRSLLGERRYSPTSIRLETYRSLWAPGWASQGAGDGLRALRSCCQMRCGTVSALSISWFTDSRPIRGGSRAAVMAEPAA